MGDTIRVRIDLYDGYGVPRQTGGDQLRVRIFETALKASASGYILDHMNGSYTAIVKCLWAGKPTILVYISYTREAVRALYHVRRTVILKTCSEKECLMHNAYRIFPNKSALP